MLTQIIIAGTFGTTIMTLVVYFFSAILNAQLRVIHVLGTMLTNQTTFRKDVSSRWESLLTGTVVHYSVGVGFAYIYILIWRYWFQATIQSSLLLGFINGVIAVLGWRTFIKLHPNPPAIPLKAYLISILAGHLVFAVGIYWCYRLS